MNDIFDPRFERLERRIEELAARVEALEQMPPAAVTADPERLPAPGVLPLAEAPTPADGEVMLGVPALVGRTLVVMGGAFAIRSLTEGGTLSPALGVSLGIVYAFVWLFFADRAAQRGRALSGAFHALGSALIVYPLLFEATTLLGLLAPVPAAILLVAANFAGLGVAWRRGSNVFAWIQQVGTLGVAVPLLFRSRESLAFGLALLAIAVASLVLAYARGWRGQRWLVAIGVDLTVAMLGGLWLFSRTPPPWLARESLLTLQLLLTAIYLGAFVLRLLMQERRITGFAVTQTVIVLLVGFEAALAVAPPAAARTIAIAALILAALLHTLLARRAEARVGHGAAVGYFASLATFLAAESVRILLPGVAAPIWLVAAVVLAAIALAGDRPILQVHAALLAAAGAVLAGLLRGALGALAFPAQLAWPQVSPLAPILLLLAATVTVLLYRASSGDAGSRLARRARTLALAVALLSIGGEVTRRLASLAGAPGPEADAGYLATLRTTVLAITALALAATGRRLARSELSIAAAVVLALGAVKLLAEDLRHGSAANLLFSLAIYGAVLIAVPALARRAKNAEPAA